MTATSFPKNPYIIGRPIHEPANFYGREEIFQFIEDNLLNEAQVILLFGQRRIGKSSILNQIPQAVNLENFVFVPLSLQGKAHKSLGEVLFELATDIRDGIHDYLETTEVDIAIPTVEQFKQNHKIFVEKFLAQIYNILEDKKLVLLIDEFDVLEDTKKNNAINLFFPYLYSILPKERQLYIIPVVGRKLDDMPNLLGLFKEAPHKQIGRLDKYDAKQLICKPTEGILNYDANSIQTILDLSGGHPYFTQLICFAIFGRLRQEQRYDVTKEDVTEIVDKALEYGEGGLAWFYSGLTMPERLIFSVVAELQEHKNRDLWQFLKQQKIGKKKALVYAYQRLLSWGFIRQEWRYIPDSIQVEKVTVELVRLWLLKRHPAGQDIKTYQQWLRDHSKLRRYFPGGVAVLTFIIGGVAWWYSPWGQIQQVRWDLAYLSGRVSNDAVINAAVAFAQDNQVQQSMKNLEQALDFAEQVKDSKDAARLLRAIAEAYGNLSQNPEALKILEQALDSANQVENSFDKAIALSGIAKVYGNLSQNPEALKILEQALDSANQVENSFDKAIALSGIAKAYGNLEQNSKAIELLEKALSAIKQNKGFKVKILGLTLGINIETKTLGTKIKAEALSAIAETAGNLTQNSDGLQILEQVLDFANQIQDSGYKARVLSMIAEAYGNLGQNSEALKILEQALVSANQTQNSGDQARVLSMIAEAYGNLGQNSEALKTLEQALDSATQIKDSSLTNSLVKAVALIGIVRITNIFEQNPEALKILERVLVSANQIQNSTSKSITLREIAVTYARQKQWYQARKLIDLITIEDIKAEALAEVLTIWAKNKNPALVEKEDE